MKKVLLLVTCWRTKSLIFRKFWKFKEIRFNLQVKQKLLKNEILLFWNPAKISSLGWECNCKTRSDVLFCSAATKPNIHVVRPTYLKWQLSTEFNYWAAAVWDRVETLSQEFVFQNIKLWIQLPFTYKELTQLVQDKIDSKKELLVIIGKQELEKGNRLLTTIWWRLY